MRWMGILMVSWMLTWVPKPTDPTLPLEERARCMRRVEEVLWRHRLWPRTDVPKPSLTQVVPESFFISRARRIVRGSNALERFWHRPVRPSDLQQELDRIVRETRDPATLQEILAALGNDPTRAAECLARPLLVERRLYDWYAWDTRIHAPLRQKIEQQLRGVHHAGALPTLDGYYVEMPLDRAAESLQDIVRTLPMGGLSSLQETETLFYVVGRLDARRVSLVYWWKESLEAWLDRQGPELDLPLNVATGSYRLRPVDTSACTPDRWTPTPVTPQARDRHTAVWTGSEMIIFGGLFSPHHNGRYNPATHTWLPIQVAGQPSPRTGHTAVWTGTEMIVWGGCTSGECQVRLATGGRYDPVSDSWASINPTDAPVGRAGHTAVWTGAEVIIWGGVNPQNPNLYEFTGGRLVLALNAWVPTAINPLVSGRGYHTAVWTGDRMVVWGGIIVGGIVSNSGGRYNPVTDTWTETTITNAPAPRYFHTAIWTGTQMVVWGGTNGQAPLSTGGRYDPGADTWTSMTDVGAPTPRYWHTAVWTGTEMVVWGGFDGNVPLSTGGIYRPATDQWTTTSLAGAPDPRYFHAAVWTGTEMIVWGGRSATSLFQTGGRYRPDADTWSALTTTGAPTPRHRAVATWTGSEMIVWGGCLDTDCNTASQDGGRWSPSDDTWQPTSLESAPAPRYAATAVWTGTQMMVWGGWGCLLPTFCGTALKTGGLYCGSVPTFTLACNPSHLQGYRGETLQTTCTVQSLAGFQEAITMNCTDLPTGVACQLSPNPVTPPPHGSADVTLTLQVGPSAPHGTHTLQVVGTSGTIQRTVPVQLQILKGPRFIGPPVPTESVGPARERGGRPPSERPISGH